MLEVHSTGRPPKPFCPLRTAMFIGAMMLMFAAPALAQQESSADSAETAIDATTAPEQDRRIRDRLQGIYAEIEAMDTIAVTVSTGVVTLSGGVDSQATAARALRLAGQVLQYPLDHGRVFNEGDDLDRSATTRAGLDVDLKHWLEPLRPAHRCPLLGGCAVFCLRRL